MSTPITFNLPDEVYRHAEHLAQLISRDLADVLADAIALSLSPISSQSAPTNSTELPPISSLSDEEVIALTQLQMESDQDQHLLELLYNQQARTLTDAERPYLAALMQV